MPNLKITDNAVTIILCLLIIVSFIAFGLAFKAKKRLDTLEGKN